MISTSDLQAILEKIEGGCVGVDLVKIGQNYAQQLQATLSGARNIKYGNISNNPGKFRVALDIEQCLDRFYGGYYSDWACGGQWNRAYQFVQLLANAFDSAQMEVTVFFDGTLKENKKLQLERNDFRQRTISVLKHIRMIGTPPPKIWWLPPSGIRTCLRNALRSVNIQVVQTIHDHTMEVIDYYHEHKLNGIIGLHPDYVICNVSRYFSSHDLRLSYKGALETKEFMVHQVLHNLVLTPEQLGLVAALLGGYILVDDVTLKLMFQKLNIEYNLDFEARIRKLADIVRNIPPNSNVEAIIKQLNLQEFSDVLKESIEYYQRKGTFAGKRYLGSKKKPITEIIADVPIVPMASETNENDEIANKILKDVNNLVNDGDNGAAASGSGDAPVMSRKCVKFVYSLPAEVLRTSYQRHIRGSMDPRIYILLTKKEMLLPQVLEDEQYREMPSVHLFYRPARQMIYAILFNLYHQKYMCSKNKDNLPSPEVIINEWIWSPNNEYKKPDEVYAIQLPWAVPTIQRLWFGTTYDDKHRRMRAFLTIMRSDSQLMLNRNYVPQHMLVMACVLRYIVTSPDRNLLTRQELDAFLVTAFSPQLVNVEYTQEMVLPGVYLRGVYLATLFMQGVETAQLANDACGVPLPWLMTNPWMFFDGKLFHLKLKMAVCLPNIRELCDDQLDVVMKIERFRKAILEDIENLVPAHIDALYRPNIYPPTPQFPGGPYNKNMPPYQNIPILPNGGYYGASTSLQPTQLYYNQNLLQQGNRNPQIGRMGVAGTPNKVQQQHQQQQQQKPGQKMGNSKNSHLRVGGVVVGSWANGSTNRAVQYRTNRSGMIRFPVSRNGRPLNNRYRMAMGGASNVGITRTINYGTKNRFAQKNKKTKAKKDKDSKIKAVKDDGTENECSSETKQATVGDGENVTVDELDKKMREILLEAAPGKIEILKNGDLHEKVETAVAAVEKEVEKKKDVVDIPAEDVVTNETAENNHVDDSEKVQNNETSTTGTPQQQQNNNNKNTGKNKKNKKKNSKTNSQETDAPVNEEKGQESAAIKA